LLESHYNCRSVLLSSPIWGSWPDINYILKVTVLSIWGALSDERSGLSLPLVITGSYHFHTPAFSLSTSFSLFLLFSPPSLISIYVHLSFSPPTVLYRLPSSILSTLSTQLFVW
jgi:hypothetical protein